MYTALMNDMQLSYQGAQHLVQEADCEMLNYFPRSSNSGPFPSFFEETPRGIIILHLSLSSASF